MALVVLGVLGYGAYHLVKSVDRGATEQVAAPPARIEQKPAPGSPPTSNPSGPAATGTTLGAPPAATVTPTASRGAAVTTAPLPPVQVPGHGPTVPPIQTAAKPPAGSVAVPATPPPVPGLTYGALNRGVRIVLRANGPTRVLVQGADGKVYFNRVLRAGDSYRVPDRVGLSLTATDAGAVGVELDGQQMGAAGHSGQMTEALSLDPQAVVDRQGGRRP
jgi:cytoskeleton protein RodZ